MAMTKYNKQKIKDLLLDILIVLIFTIAIMVVVFIVTGCGKNLDIG